MTHVKMPAYLLSLQGSGSQLATSSLDLVQPRPGLHPGDLTFTPDAAALLAERQSTARECSAAAAPPNAGANPSVASSRAASCGLLNQNYRRVGMPSEKVAWL